MGLLDLFSPRVLPDIAVAAGATLWRWADVPGPARKPVW